MTSQPPQASASTNSAIRAFGCQTDGVSQENASESSPDASPNKLPVATLRVEFRDDGLGNETEPGVASIYFIQCGDDGGPIKIGQAVDPLRRASELQIGCPYQLTVLAAIAVDDADLEERRLHKRFAISRIRGEWFEPSPDLRAAIAALRTSVSRGVLAQIRPATGPGPTQQRLVNRKRRAP